MISPLVLNQHQADLHKVYQQNPMDDIRFMLFALRMSYRLAGRTICRFLSKRYYIVLSPYTSITGQRRFRFHGSFRWKWMATLYVHKVRCPYGYERHIDIVKGGARKSIATTAWLAVIANIGAMAYLILWSVGMEPILADHK